MKRLAIVTGALLLNACTSLSDVSLPNPFSREKPVAVAEVRRSAVCNSESDAPRAWLFPDVAAVRAWDLQRNARLVGNEPMEEAPYALVEHGARTTGGYGLAISRTAGRKGDIVVLKATFMGPAPGRMVTQMLTSPCVLVALPPAYWQVVEVVDQDGRRRAISAEAR